MNNYFCQNGNNPMPYYGQPYKTENIGYAAPIINDVTICQNAFKQSPLTNTWDKETSNSKGKMKVTPLTSRFDIKNVMMVYDEKELKNCIIDYCSGNTNYRANIPAKDYLKGKFAQYMDGIIRLPGCNKSQLNDLVSYVIKTFPGTVRITLYSHQGWMRFEDGSVCFSKKPEKEFIPFELLTESICRRKLSKPKNSPEEIVNNWVRIFFKNPCIRFMGDFSIGSLFLDILNSVNIYPEQFLIVEPSDSVDEAKLAAILATNNIAEYPVPNLESDADSLIKELGYVYDGVALFRDHSFADEEDKVIDGIKVLIRAVRRDTEGADTGRNMIAVISENAAYPAVRLASDNVFVINTAGIELDFTAEQIRSAKEEMEALVLSTIYNKFDITKYFIAENFEKILTSFHKSGCGAKVNTAIIVSLVEAFLREYFGIGISDCDKYEILSIVNNNEDYLLNSNDVIVNNFACVLSEHFRTGKFRAVIKRKNMSFDKDGQTAILSGDKLYVSAEMIDAVLAEMNTTHSKNSLIKALKTTDKLNHTDGNTHPVEVHNSLGRNQRLYMYDISTDLLDSDIIYKLENLANDAFLLSVSEIPESNFVTFINDRNSCKVGKLVRYQDEENNHCYITGQSGYGKTHFMCQLIPKYYEIGHQIVIFDSSDSFTYEALCRNLNSRFVDKNIVFHSLDKVGIPINLLRTDSNADSKSKRDQLMGILTAGIGELSDPQFNTLKSAISDLLKRNEPVRTGRILDVLKEYGTTSESLHNRLEPLFEDIDHCGMTNNSWGDFLGNSRKIIVIHTDSMFTEKGSQIIDMMLATLYNYQCENCSVSLDIFIDEIQGQNFSKISPIHTIMKEGRKRHMSFFGVTQDCYPRNTELGKVMSKADTQIFLKPTPDSECIAAKELRFNKADMSRFDAMQRGDCIIKGSFYSKEQGRNIPTIISGHVEDYPKISESYYGNAI